MTDRVTIAPSISTGQYPPMEEIANICRKGPLRIKDHFGGFDKNYRNKILDYLDNEASNLGIQFDVELDAVISIRMHETYKNLKLSRVDHSFFARLTSGLEKYKEPPPQQFNNFLCSFNGSNHISRQLLVSILRKFNWYNPDYCSQVFTLNGDIVDGAIENFTGTENTRFYRKFFMTGTAEPNSYDYKPFDHLHNVKVLEDKLTGSFLHLVSETRATDYNFSASEKFFYSVVTKGLFLTYGQPKWHTIMSDHLGLKLYTNIFDYSFDSIENPVERLVALMTMISKFSHLTKDEWQDLYLMELDNINYNYDHFHSGKWVEYSKKLTESANNKTLYI